MKKSVKTLLHVLILIAVSVIIAVSVSAADETPPVRVIMNYGSDYEYEITPSKVNGEYYFFLPGTAEIEKLHVLYTGKNMMGESKGEPKYKKGDDFTVNASDGTFSVKEYTKIVNNVASTNEGVLRYEFKVMKGGNIGAVYITLDNGNKAMKRINSSKDNEEPGDIIVTDVLGNVVYDGGMKKMTGHGFTSFIASGDTNVKNSYNFNLENKAELINGAGEMKKWVLLSPRRSAGDRDTSGISQIAAFKAFSAIIGNKRASIEGEFIDLYINGEYRGIYILTERMNNGGAIDVKDLEDYVTPKYDLTTRRDDKNNNGRDPALNAGIHKYTYDRSAKIDPSVDITGGYVLEVMCENYDGCGFETKYGVDITIKSPEICTKEMVQYIAEYVQQFENAIFSKTGYNSEGKHYTEYVDEKSLADLILVYSHYINFEYFRTSTYIYKDADGEPNDTLTFGPAWDFETGAAYLKSDKTLFGLTNGFVYNVDQQYVWSEQLWKHGDFMQLMEKENERLKDALAQINHIDSSTTVPSLDSIIAATDPSANMSDKRWGLPKFKSLAKDFVEAAKARYDYWYDELWNPDNYLLSVGVTLEPNDDGTVTLTADVKGKHTDMIKWYRIYPNKPSKSENIANGKDSVTVEADGAMYYCVVTGPNNAYYKLAAGEIFREKTLEMKSGNVVAEIIIPPETEPIETAPPETTPTENEGGCGSNSSAAAVIFTAIFGTAIIKKKK